MKLAYIKTLLKITTVSVSREAVLRYSIFVMLAVSIFLIILDAVIFYNHYQAATVPASPASFRKIEISRENLDKALEIIQKRGADTKK